MFYNGLLKKIRFIILKCYDKIGKDASSPSGLFRKMVKIGIIRFIDRDSCLMAAVCMLYVQMVEMASHFPT